MDLPAAWALHAKTMNNKNVLTAKGIGKVVKSGASDLVILRDIDLEITRGEAVAVIGASGSGKSTLLAILAGLDTPSAGRVEIDGADLFALDEDARARLRAMQVGFVFQSFQLLPGYTALENVMLPLELAEHPEAERLSSEILDRVGLGERLDHYPKHLSGGEQQRVALARAFVVRPKLLLADEPTGSLDAESGAAVIALLFELNREYGTTLVLVTHDEALAARCARVVRLVAGRMLARDWRAGELGVLAAALVIAVASVTSVGFFADRVGQALERDAHQLLGADLVLAADHPWSARIVERLRGAGVQSAEALNFVSMALASGQSQLAGVKAVSENYPLRGRLRIAPAPGAPDAAAERGPAAGTVWLEERLVSALQAPVGSTIRLGKSQLQVAAIITLEPERNTNFFNIAPRLMMSLADVPATGLVQTGSRIWYYLYAAGAPEKIRTFEKSVSLERGQRVDNLESGRPEVRASIERARRFLALTALLAAVLAGVAIALGARR